MGKIKVVVSGIFYPLAMMHYFIRAFQRREDVELWTVGPFTGDWIPWNGGMRLPQRYLFTPNLPLPQQLIGQSAFAPDMVQKVCPWKPDLWVQVDAGWRFSRRPDATMMVTVGTDPHVLDYSISRGYSDVFFNMQLSYRREGDVYLPYAYDPVCHAPLPNTEKIYDACLVGLHYERRDQLMNALRMNGLNVYYEIGPIYDEFQQLYNQSRVAINWSSLLDLNARTFEAMGMGVPLVTNRIPDLSNFFVEGDHYLGFDTVEEGVSQVKRLLSDPEMAAEMAGNALRKVQATATWDHRVASILERCKLV